MLERDIQFLVAIQCLRGAFAQLSGDDVTGDLQVLMGLPVRPGHDHGPAHVAMGDADIEVFCWVVAFVHC
jgi:hypothetical protein